MAGTFPARILYGADYNPEQWPETVWVEDMRFMKQARVNMVSINIFSWAMLEPQPGEYRFETLDRVVDMLAEHGIAADLATATASPPTWMSRLYPLMLPVTWDGRRMYHGSRQHFCPSSPDYRRKATQLVRHLAERYQEHPALAMWHVNNEYGCLTACHCDTCAIAFRDWLQARYRTLDALNNAWSTNFWSQRYYSWEDILPPRFSPAQINPGQSLDYRRFMSDSLLQCYLTEARILHEITPDIPVTTNFMAAFKPVDYFAWASHLDIISVDIYPPHTAQAWETAITHDLMRSLKGGRPHLVMEQTPSQVNWMPQNPHKRPGNLRLQSFQALAHGADGVMYFQWRQSLGGAEKFHSAVVSHEGSEHNRIFRQVAQIGAELERLSPHIAGSRMQAQVALVMDWQNWWAVEYTPGPSDRLRYWECIGSWYRALHRLNVAVDFVLPDADLSRYRLVIAPLLYMLRPGAVPNLERFVQEGGIFVTTFFSGIVDQNDRVMPGGYPAALRKMLGIYVEEFDPWTPQMTNEVVIQEGLLQGTYLCSLWGEVIHLEGAQALGIFASDYYAQGPALTLHRFGEGRTYYIATQGSDELLSRLTHLLCQEAVIPPVMNAPQGVEATARVQTDRHILYFLLNHNETTAQVILPAGKFTSLLTGEEVEGQLEIAARDVVVLLHRS
jgi:beta-galactosidase